MRDKPNNTSPELNNSDLVSGAEPGQQPASTDGASGTSAAETELNQESTGVVSELEPKAGSEQPDSDFEEEGALPIDLKPLQNMDQDVAKKALTALKEVLKNLEESNASQGVLGKLIAKLRNMKRDEKKELEAAIAYFLELLESFEKPEQERDLEKHYKHMATVDQWEKTVNSPEVNLPALKEFNEALQKTHEVTSITIKKNGPVGLDDERLAAQKKINDEITKYNNEHDPKLNRHDFIAFAEWFNKDQNEKLGKKELKDFVPTTVEIKATKKGAVLYIKHDRKKDSKWGSTHVANGFKDWVKLKKEAVNQNQNAATLQNQPQITVNNAAPTAAKQPNDQLSQVPKLEPRPENKGNQDERIQQGPSSSKHSSNENGVTVEGEAKERQGMSPEVKNASDDMNAAPASPLPPTPKGDTQIDWRMAAQRGMGTNLVPPAVSPHSSLRPLKAR